MRTLASSAQRAGVGNPDYEPTMDSTDGTYGNEERDLDEIERKRTGRAERKAARRASRLAEQARDDGRRPS